MLRSILVILILIPGMIAGLRDRFAALQLYIWFALFRPQEWLWVDVTAFRLSLMVGLILVIPCLLTGVLPELTHPLSIGAVLFLFTALGAQVSAYRPDIGWTWIDYIARLILVSTLAVRLISTRQRFVVTLAVIAGSFGFHAAKAGVAFILGGGVQFASGVAGAFPDNEGYALGTAMIMPLLAAAGQNMERRWLRWGFFAAVPLCALTIVGTFSRGGFLALAAAAMTMAFLQRRRLMAIGGLVATCVGLLWVVPMPAGYFDRMQTIQTYDQVADESALGRLHFWQVALIMVADQPFGIGLHNYEPTYDRYDFTNGQYGHNRAVHNSHLEVLAETGYLGAAVWIGLFAFAFFACIRVRVRARNRALQPDDQAFLRSAAAGLMASMVAFIVGGSFLAIALNDLTWLTFSLVAALDRISCEMVSRAAEPKISSAQPLDVRRPLVSAARRGSPNALAPGVRCQGLT
jgi:probable O-glycosylation ligase (exosortase A-associated)